MELLLERTFINNSTTVGRLSIITRTFDEYLGREDKEFICDTIEPPMKLLGVNPHSHHHHKSAIPPGRYPVVITPSNVFDICLPLIVGVPKMMSKDVRIQIGNSVEDIEVGLIPGAYRGDGQIVASRNMVFTLKRLIYEAKQRGEGVFLTVLKDLVEEGI